MEHERKDETTGRRGEPVAHSCMLAISRSSATAGAPATGVAQHVLKSYSKTRLSCALLRIPPSLAQRVTARVAAPARIQIFPCQKRPIASQKKPILRQKRHRYRLVAATVAPATSTPAALVPAAALARAHAAQGATAPTRLE